MTRILLLGGTTEASQMAKALSDQGLDAIFSYAGRTGAPLAQPLPTRVGGFGGVAGLVAYLRDQSVTHVIDATHPFAAQMSTHALQACATLGLPLVALERAPWVAGPGDRWTHVPSMAAAAAALPVTPARIFLAIGRLQLEVFSARPEHHYLLRLVDPPVDLPFAAEVILARGPFTAEGDRDLLRGHRIDLVIAKNAGGQGAEAKPQAARALGLPVILVDRPALPPRLRLDSVDQVMAWLHADLGA